MKASDDPVAFAKALKRYTDVMAEKAGAKAALEATGLSHAQADLAWYGDPRNPQHVVPNSVKLKAVPGKKEAGYDSALLARGLQVAELRLQGHSLGAIAALVGLPETQVRNALSATGIAAEGTRIGKGGRWLEDDPRKYLGDRTRIGLEAADPRRVDASKFTQQDKVESVLPQKVAALRKAVQGTAVKRVAKKVSAPRKVPAKKAVAKKAA